MMHVRHTFMESDKIEDLNGARAMIFKQYQYSVKNGLGANILKDSITVSHYNY